MRLNGEAKAIVHAAGISAVAHARAKVLVERIEAFPDRRAIELADALVRLTRELNTQLSRAALEAAERLGAGTRDVERLIESSTAQVVEKF